MNEILRWFNNNQGLGVILSVVVMVAGIISWLWRRRKTAIHSSKQKNKNRLSTITPKTMIRVFKNNSVIHAESITKKYYVGLMIETSGAIERVSPAHSYFVFSFLDKDGVRIAANFDNPVSSEISILKIGDKINVVGKIFNVGENIIVLDHCILKP